MFLSKSTCILNYVYVKSFCVFIWFFKWLKKSILVLLIIIMIKAFITSYYSFYIIVYDTFMRLPEIVNVISEKNNTNRQTDSIE